jgi:hypothetical protein
VAAARHRDRDRDPMTQDCVRVQQTRSPRHSVTGNRRGTGTGIPNHHGMITEAKCSDSSSPTKLPVSTGSKFSDSPAPARRRRGRPGAATAQARTSLVTRTLGTQVIVAGAARKSARAAAAVSARPGLGRPSSRNTRNNIPKTAWDSVGRYANTT